MGVHRCREGSRQTHTLGVLERRGKCQKLLGLLPKRSDGMPECKQLPFGVAYQLHQNLALSSTLSAKTTHDLGQCLLDVLGLPREDCRAVAALLRDFCDEGQRFFCALYSVVASVTR